MSAFGKFVSLFTPPVWEVMCEMPLLLAITAYLLFLKDMTGDRCAIQGWAASAKIVESQLF